MMSDPLDLPAGAAGGGSGCCRYGQIVADPAAFGLTSADGEWLREYAATKPVNPAAHDTYDVVALKVRREASANGFSTTLGPATISRHINQVCRCHR